MGIIGGIIAGAGLIGAATQKRPKFNFSAMDSVYSLIQKQYADVENYFKESNQAFEGQYQQYYGQSMQDAINSIAGSGIFESPVSQNFLNRQQIALGETYARGKSQLAGQKMQAMGQVDQQKISYYQNLANLQYQRAQQKAQENNQLFGTIAGLGVALI